MEIEALTAIIFLSASAVVVLIVFNRKNPREKAIQLLITAGATSREHAMHIKDIPDTKIQDFIMKEIIDTTMHGRSSFILKENETGKIYLNPESLISPKINTRIILGVSALPIMLLVLALLAGLTGFKL